MEYQQMLQLQQQQLPHAAAAASTVDIGQRPVCQFCRKELKNVHSLNVHISRYHSETNESSIEVICPVCERKYGNKYSLRTHMHLNHKDQLHLLGSAKKGRKPTDGEEGQGDENQQEGRRRTSAVEKDDQYYY